VPRKPISDTIPNLSKIEELPSDENSDISTPELPNLDDLF
jgi:hypothetical protein